MTIWRRSGRVEKSVECPYCGYRNLTELRSLEGEDKVLQCHDGACGEKFVVELDVRVDATVRALADVDRDDVHDRLEQASGIVPGKRTGAGT